MLEPFRSRGSGNRYHPHLAFGAARAVDRQQLWIGSCPRHAQKNNAARKPLSVRYLTQKGSNQSLIGETLGLRARLAWGWPGRAPAAASASRFTKALRYNGKFIACS
jgi:hypothetical protein